jgi:hypothetical protein
MPSSPDDAKTVTPAATSEVRIGSNILIPAAPNFASHDPYDEDNVVMCASGAVACLLPVTSSKTLAKASARPARLFGAK